MKEFESGKAQKLGNLLDSKCNLFQMHEKIRQRRRTETREKAVSKEWTEYWIHTALLKHDYVAHAFDASHRTSSAHLWFQLLPLGVGWGIFPWELKLIRTMPHHNHQVVSFHFPSRDTFSDHWNHLGQQASAAHKDGRVNTPWQTSTNNSSLQACRWTFWEAFSLPLGGPFCIWPQWTMIFITHTHIGFSSVFISLYLIHAFWDIFQMNYLSLSPWPCFRPCFGNPNEEENERV